MTLGDTINFCTIRSTHTKKKKMDDVLALAPAATVGAYLSDEGDLFKIFKHFDKDGNDTIDIHELHGFMSEVLGHPPKDPDVQRIKDLLDTDGDHRVSFEELKAAIARWEGEISGQGSPQKRGREGYVDSPTKKKSYRALVKQFFEQTDHDDVHLASTGTLEQFHAYAKSKIAGYVQSSSGGLRATLEQVAGLYENPNFWQSCLTHLLTGHTPVSSRMLAI